MRLMDDIGLDSLDLTLELTVIIEDRYGVDIFEDEIITTVEQTLEKNEGLNFFIDSSKKFSRLLGLFL